MCLKTVCPGEQNIHPLGSVLSLSKGVHPHRPPFWDARPSAEWFHRHLHAGALRSLRQKVGGSGPRQDPIYTCMEPRKPAQSWSLQRNLGPSVPYRPPLCCLPQALPAGPAFQSMKNTFLQPERAQSWDTSVQILSTQQGFRAPLCFVQLSTSLASLVKYFPRQGASVPVRKEAESILPGMAARTLPPEPGCSQPLPGLSTRVCFLPASLASFLQQLTGAPPLSPCSASQPFSCAAPPAPSCPPTASSPTPHIGTGFPGPLWLGPFRVCLVPCPNQQLQVPTFPSHSHKVAIVHCTKEDHPVFMPRRRKEVYPGASAPPSCPVQTPHITRKPNTHLTEAHMVFVADRCAWHRMGTRHRTDSEGAHG